MTSADPEGHDPARLPMPPPPPPFEPDHSLITQLEKGVGSAETKSGS
jgi:hypothetical protein